LVHIPNPGSYPLVVEPIVEGTLLAQTLIDGGVGSMSSSSTP
jgi:hypothetical protein